MVRFLKWLKMKLPFIWLWIETINGWLVSLMYGKRIAKAAADVLSHYSAEPFSYRSLTAADIAPLSRMLMSQTDDYMRFFHPHGFDEATLMRLLKNKSVLMLGTFKDDEIIGYYFIRFFANGQCFRGNFVDANHQGKGIGGIMVRQMTEIGLAAGFRVFATVSKRNLSSMASTKAYNEIKIIKELPDDDVLIEHLSIKK